MHLLQLQQQFTEKLKDLRLRHERDIAALHEHFDPLIAAASSLASRHKQNGSQPCSTPGTADLSTAKSAQPEQLRDAAERNQPLLSHSSAFSPGFKLVSPPSASSSPVSSNSTALSSTNAVNQGVSGGRDPDVAASQSPFGTGISSSYRRSIVVRHMQAKSL
jgi:hypothetical protein